VLAVVLLAFGGFFYSNHSLMEHNFFGTKPRHGGYSTPGTNAAEDSILQIANEINLAAQDVFTKASAEVKGFSLKQAGNAEDHAKQVHETAMRGLKSVQKKLAEKEVEMVSRYQRYTRMRDSCKLIPCNTGKIVSRRHVQGVFQSAREVGSLKIKASQ